MELTGDVFVLTRQGYEQMQRELQEILTVKRPEVIESIREARQLGTLNENSDYEDAKRLQAMLEARIRELKAILANAKVIDAPSSEGVVGIGSRVVVKCLEDDEEEEYVIVGPAESSPSEGRISHESCVGRELIGKKAGDEVKVEVPSGVITFRILSVS
ncbi:MAG: transcription elongation factor GreA [Armatimonadota bacterium]|nr:transcription elongation factor GreA [Armatimonadota bacterium]